MKQILIIVFLLLSLTCHSQNEWKMPEEEQKAIHVLVEKVIKLGFPDAKEAKFYVGRISVRSQFDPEKQAPILPMRYCHMQMTDTESDEMIYGFTIPGFHIQLKNGSWLLDLHYLIETSDKITVITKDVEIRETDGLIQKAAAKFPFTISPDFKKWIKQLPENKHSMMEEVFKKVIPLGSYLQIGREELPLILILLTRAGVQDASVISYAIADLRCRSYWQLYYWSGKPGPFDPTNRYPGIGNIEKEWREELSHSYEMELPHIAFRRALHRYFFHVLKTPNKMLPLEKIEAIALATLDPEDPQNIKNRIENLVAGNKVPSYPKKDADLATQLMSWGTPDPNELLNYRVTSKREKGSVSMSTQFFQPTPAYVPKPEDLDELFELLDDNRPTRYFDYQGPRTLGENALRAIAVLLKKNPLEFVNYADLQPWTDEKRKKANIALREWWKNNRDKQIIKNK